jgi:hypothetical protein
MTTLVNNPSDRDVMFGGADGIEIEFGTRANTVLSANPTAAYGRPIFLPRQPALNRSVHRQDQFTSLSTQQVEAHSRRAAHLPRRRLRIGVSAVPAGIFAAVKDNSFTNRLLFGDLHDHIPRTARSDAVDPPTPTHKGHGPSWVRDLYTVGS